MRHIVLCGASAHVRMTIIVALICLLRGIQKNCQIFQCFNYILRFESNSFFLFFTIL